MQITIDTHNLSDLDIQVLALLSGGDVTTFPTGGAVDRPVGTWSADTEEVEGEDEPDVEPDVEPEPEPDPEPMAEEPVVENEDPVDDEPADEDGDEMSDEDLLALAVKKATELVGKGKAAQVRTALEAAGASRVRELNTDNVREFFKALP